MECEILFTGYCLFGTATNKKWNVERPFWCCYINVEICLCQRAQIVAEDQEVNSKLGLHSVECNNLVQIVQKYILCMSQSNICIWNKYNDSLYTVHVFPLSSSKQWLSYAWLFYSWTLLSKLADILANLRVWQYTVITNFVFW